MIICRNCCWGGLVSIEVAKGERLLLGWRGRQGGVIFREIF